MGMTRQVVTRSSRALRMAEKGLASAPYAAIGAPFQIGVKTPAGFHSVGHGAGLTGPN